MKKFLFLLILPSSFIIHHSFSQSPDWLWAKAIGATSSEQGNSIALDASGNVYTTGSFLGTVDFDPGAGTFNLTAAGGFGIFISKLDASGNFVWAKAMSGAGGGFGNSIALDPAGSGEIYTTGQFGGTVDFDPGAATFNLTGAGLYDIFISKLDASGNFVWAKAMSGTNLEYGRSIALDPAGSGDVYSTGGFQGTVDFDPGVGTFNLTSIGNIDIFISKLDGSGNFVWAKTMGGTNDDYGQSIALDVSGNVYTTGSYQGTADFDPDAGVFNLISPGLYSCFISKLNSPGNFVWAKAFVGGDIGGLSIALDTSGNIYTTGSFGGGGDFDPGTAVFTLIAAGSKDMFISKLNSPGNFVWVKGMGGAGSLGTFGYSIALDASGNVYTTGQFFGTVDFDPGAGVVNLTSVGDADIFISKLNSPGNFVWAKASGGTNNDYSVSIAVDTVSNSYMAGYFQSPSISFGSATLTNAGGNDIFIAKLDFATGTKSLEYTNGISVYPNPSGGTIQIQAGNMQYVAGNIEIYSAVGEKVYSSIFNYQSSIINLDASNGIYFLHIKTENNSVTQKLIIQK